MIEEYKKYCTGCRACEKLCPKNAIEMKKDVRGFLYPSIDYNKCIKCKLCKNRCPIDSKEIEKEKKAYAAYNKDEAIRRSSSSGGVFSLLAEFVLENNGVVFGAALNDELIVEHMFVEDKESLSKLRSSKYVQSNTENSFEKAKEFLESERLVYFSGTPCQIEGLKAYLSKDYDNLITQDIICHGVPSPKVWSEYLKYKEGNLKHVNFRCKEKSTWGDYQLKFTYEDRIEYINHNDDTFMKLFLGDVILRESCYQCKFKKKNRISDFTLADFWGVEKVDNSFNDNKGTSLIIVNSDKARRIFEQISDKIVKKEVNFEEAIQFNPSMTKSANRSERFEEVSELIEKEDFVQIFNGG